VVKTSVLHEIEGFDEFYQVWGAEDDDLYNRLQAAGYSREMVEATQIPVYHHLRKRIAFPRTGTFRIKFSRH
jgi:GT2 family glycosyltransferase